MTYIHVVYQVAPSFEPPSQALASSRHDEELLSPLIGLALPIVAQGPMGLDGTTYSLKISVGLTNVTLRWWEEIPAEWQSLSPIVEALSLRLQPAPYAPGEYF